MEILEDKVDEVIKGVYDAIGAYNPKLEFGVSPFGVWRTKTTDLEALTLKELLSVMISNMRMFING